MAAAVPDGASVVDVGSGDGLLARHLVALGRRVVASDVAAGPCAAVGAALAGTGAEVRMGDGLAVCEPGEVAVAVIAGMGGRRMRDIIAAAPEVVAALQALVLQPVQHADELCEALPALGLRCLEVTRVRQRRREYRVVVAAPEGTG